MSKAKRWYVRIGLIVGCAGFVLIALAQLAWAFAAVFLLALVALAAGLATAKWLPRSLWGKQFVTGARAGAVACGIASVGLLVSLAVASHTSVDALARRSHLLGLQLESMAHALSPVGWVGVALVLALVGSAIGTGLAGIVALLTAWDKNQRAIQVIDRAREAAQRSPGRNALGAPYSGQSRPPSGALPILPVYPPPGQMPPPDATWQSPAPMPADRPGHRSPRTPGRANALHDALAAWGEDAAQAGRGRDEESAPRPPSNRDDWLC